MPRAKMTPEEKLAAKQQRESLAAAKRALAEEERRRSEAEWELTKDAKKIELFLYAKAIQDESLKFDLYAIREEEWHHYDAKIAVEFHNISFTYYLWGDEETFRLDKELYINDYRRIKGELDNLMEEVKQANAVEEAVRIEMARKQLLREKTLAKLSDEEIEALGLRK